MKHQDAPMNRELANRLRDASRRFGERSTALTEADIDVASAARKAYRRAQLEQEAADSQVVEEDQTSGRQALGAAALMIEKEVQSDIRLGIRGDLLLGVGPAVLVVGALGVVALAFDAVITLRLVAGIGAVLLGLALVAASAASGVLSTKLSNAVRMLGGQRLLATSAGALVGGVLLFVAAGVALSQYTKGRQLEARTEIAREFAQVDSSLQLALAAQQVGIETTRALALAGRATGVDWHLEPGVTASGGLVLAKTSLSKAEAVVGYPVTGSPTTEPRLLQTRLVSERGQLLGARTYLVAKIAQQPSLSAGTVRLELVGSPDAARAYSVPQSLPIPPVGTTVVASVMGDREVVLMQPVDWLAARVKDAAVGDSIVAAPSRSAAASAAKE